MAFLTEGFFFFSLISRFQQPGTLDPPFIMSVMQTQCLGRGNTILPFHCEGPKSAVPETDSLKHPLFGSPGLYLRQNVWRLIRECL